MQNRSSIACFALLLLALSVPVHAGEIIDQIVATVNGHIILQSDWEDEMRFEAFSAGRALEHISASDRKAALDHLIDQELLREQLRSSDSAHAAAEEVERRVREIRAQYPQADSDAGWRALLEQSRLSGEDLRSRVALDLDLKKLVDSGPRTGLTLDAKRHENYDNQELLPQLRQAGGRDVPLSDVSGKIKEVLTEKKINQLLTAWLQDLRAGSEIRSEGLAAVSGARRND